MNYFTYEALLEVHDMVLAVSGGMPGVKDEGLIRSPVEFISEGQYYPTFADKLTHLVYSLIKNHGFNDGNKRTALAAGALCLFGASALQVSSRIHAFSFGRGGKGGGIPHTAGAQLLVGQFALLTVCLCPLCGAATGLVCLANRLMQAG